MTVVRRTYPSRDVCRVRVQNYTETQSVIIITIMMIIIIINHF